jgi:hypothetical protein
LSLWTVLADHRPARTGHDNRNALFPSLTGEIMKLVNRFLPAPVGVEGDELKSGSAARAEQRAPSGLPASATPLSAAVTTERRPSGVSEASFR